MFEFGYGLLVFDRVIPLEQLKLEKIKHGFKTLAECRDIRGVDDTSSSSQAVVDMRRHAVSG
jgi:hypothetical protein